MQSKFEEEKNKIKEEYEFQEKWLRLFLRGTCLLQEVPTHTLISIFNRMDAKSFPKMMRTCKWVHGTYRENRSKILIRDGTLTCKFDWELVTEKKEDFSPTKMLHGQRLHLLEEVELPTQLILVDDEDFPINYTDYGKMMNKFLRTKYYYQGEKISFFDLHKNKKNLTNGLKIFQKGYIQAKTILFMYSPFQKEILQYFQPSNLRALNLEEIPDGLSFAEYKSIFLSFNVNEQKFAKIVEQFGNCCNFVGLERNVTESNTRFNIAKLLPVLKKLMEERLESPVEESQVATLFEYGEGLASMGNAFPSPKVFAIRKKENIRMCVVAKSGNTIVTIIVETEYCSPSRFKIIITSASKYEEWRSMLDTTGFDICDTESDTDSLSSSEDNMRSFRGSADLAIDYLSEVKALYVDKDQTYSLLKKIPPPEPEPYCVEFLQIFGDYEPEPEIVPPHQEKWINAERPPNLPMELLKETGNMAVWLKEARKCVEIRKLWLSLLQRGKFVLQLAPTLCVVEVAKRVRSSSDFVNLFNSCKWVSEMIDGSRLSYRKNLDHITINASKLDSIIMGNMSFGEFFTNMANTIEFFKINCFTFVNFNRHSMLLKRILYYFAGRKIIVNDLVLHRSLLTQELLDIFKPNCLEFNAEAFEDGNKKLVFPPNLKTIAIRQLRGENIVNTLEELTGSHIDVVLFPIKTFPPDFPIRFQNDRQNLSDLLQEYLNQLILKRCHSNIKFNLQPLDQQIFHSRLTQFSERSNTICIYRSMVKGRIGEWKYCIRLEKASIGAAGIIAYFDMTTVGDEIGASSDHQIKYFRCFQEFKDCFDETVETHRSAKNWMDPEDSSENHDIHIFDCYVPHNEQAEAEFFEEVKTRFF